MKPNVLICGKTGIGKSSLINYIFGEDVAKTGSSKGVTRGVSKLYKSEKINIYDSEGYEIGDEKQRHYKKIIFEEFLTNNKKAAASEKLHAVWYTISAAGMRIEDIDNQYINLIKEYGYPICILLTKLDELNSESDKQKITKAIAELQPKLKIFYLSVKEGEIQEYCTLEKLLDWTQKTIPDNTSEDFRDSLNAEQRSIQLKISKARKISFAYAGAVAAAAFQPLPIADAPIMVAIQAGMMTHITSCFGFDPALFNFKTVLSGLGGPFAAAVTGRTLVSLVKFIPGLGTAIGGAINAATGGALTLAIANIYIGVLASAAKKNGKINEQSIVNGMKRDAQNIDMDEMKKEWEKNKDSYSKSEAEDILNKAKKES